MRAIRVVTKGLFIVLRVALALFAVAVPFFGAWAGSSLAAYAGGPLWVALVAGLIAFPLLPLSWEAWAAWKRKRTERDRVLRPRVLTFTDRMILRTLTINVLFIGALLSFGPKLLFTALTARGDWMFDGQRSPHAETGREAAFWAADRLASLYASTQQNEFQRDEAQQDDPGDSGAGEVDRHSPTPQPAPVPPDPPATDDTDTDLEPDGSTDPDSAQSPQPAPPPSPGLGPESPAWPLADTLHPLVSQVPPETETDFATVARYLRQHEPNDTRLVKAIHDYIADRIAYDAPNYAAGRYPPQEPEHVFRNRIAVCAGYAQLFVAMAETVGLEAAYVVGATRHLGHDAAGVSHAWNAVRLDGSWYLLDITWDAGSVDGPVFTKQYRTNYLFVPPRIMLSNHLPEDPRWQLVDTPISMGEFNRQAMMQPGFFRHGLELHSPLRSSVTVDGTFEARLSNPLHHSVIATIQPAGSGRSRRQRCEVDGRDALVVTCSAGSPGHYRVWLFASERRVGQHSGVGGFEVVSR